MQTKYADILKENAWRNPYPVGSEDWHCCQQIIWEIVNDAGASFDDDVHYANVRRALSDLAETVGRGDPPGRPLIWARCKP
jgi:hypothetical protein